MHQTDDDGHASNQFTDGDPSVPTRPTQLSSAMMNAVVNELCNIVTNAGVALVKGTHTQLRDTVMNLKTVQTAIAKKIFVAGSATTHPAIDATGADGGSNGGGGSAASGGHGVVGKGGNTIDLQGGHGLVGTGGAGNDGGVGVVGVGATGGLSSAQGGDFTGGEAYVGNGGAGVKAKGGAGISGGGGAGVGAEVEGGAQFGGGYAKAIHAAHGDVHVDDGKLTVDNPGSSIALEALQTPTLINSWVSDNGSPAFSEPAAYFKDAQGMVHLQGVIKSGSSNTVAFNLPAGYRPSRDRFFSIVTNVSAIAGGQIRIGSGLGAVAAGDVFVTSTATMSTVPLDGICFRP